jgi:acyl carrier protein
MSDGTVATPESRVTALIQRLFTERSIARAVAPDDDLRAAGLSSMDMLNLVLSVEAEFDLTIPESGITPANFRSIAAISALVVSLRAPG